MVYVFCDYRIPEKMREELKKRGFHPLPVSGDGMLSPAVCGHPDLLVARVGETLVVEEEVVRRYPALSRCDGVRVSLERASAVYPNEAKFCVKAVGDTLYHGKAVAEDIRLVAEEEGYSLREVRQGYVACNLLVVDEGHIVTSDPSIEKALSSRGVEVLKIREGFVNLPPYPHGFIGGASGVYGDTVYFLGDVMSHPDGKKIEEFISGCGMRAVCLSDGELFDGGGLVFWQTALTIEEDA